MLMKRYILEGQLLFGLRKIDKHIPGLIQKKVSSVGTMLVHFENGDKAYLKKNNYPHPKLGDVVCSSDLYDYYRSEESRDVALKRMRGELSGCRYCSDEGPGLMIYDHAFEQVGYVFVSKRGELIVNSDYATNKRKINYCPICGRLF